MTEHEIANLHNMLYGQPITEDYSYKFSTGRDLERHNKSVHYTQWQNRKTASKFWQWLDQNIPMPQLTV